MLTRKKDLNLINESARKLSVHLYLPSNNKVVSVNYTIISYVIVWNQIIPAFQQRYIRNEYWHILEQVQVNVWYTLYVKVTFLGNGVVGFLTIDFIVSPGYNKKYLGVIHHTIISSIKGFIRFYGTKDTNGCLELQLGNTYNSIKHNLVYEVSLILKDDIKFKSSIVEYDVKSSYVYSTSLVNSLSNLDEFHNYSILDITYFVQKYKLEWVAQFISKNVVKGEMFKIVVLVFYDMKIYQYDKEYFFIKDATESQINSLKWEIFFLTAYAGSYTNVVLLVENQHIFNKLQIYK